jgi:multidrug efflux pump subunit AcrA (membrane-fusion protein)
MHFLALENSTTPLGVAKIIRIVAILFFVIPFLMLFLPWVQNVTADGSVIALTPLERPQTVDAPVSGVVDKWYVQEGTVVKAGDLLVEIRDLDAEFKSRLGEQRDLVASKSQAKSAELKAYQSQLQSLASVKTARVSAAGFKLSMANQKILSFSENLAASQANLEAANAQKIRLERLLNEGLVSKRDLEVAERDATVAARMVNSAQANLQSARAEANSANAELRQVENDAEATINSTMADVNKIKSELAENERDLNTSEVNLARQQAQIVRAPKAGTVFRMQANGASQMIQQGQQLLTIVPVATQKAVELLVKSRDAPLIEPGNRVRLEFAGWPAMQVSGWPNVGLGTFAGKVSFVDATDDGTGFFRIVVVPEHNESDWPSSRFLRQGVSAKGWILLERVRIGYEIWRVLNGFPQRFHESVIKSEVTQIRRKP